MCVTCDGMIFNKVLSICVHLFGVQEDFLGALTKLAPDLCVTAAYGNILPQVSPSSPKRALGDKLSLIQTFKNLLSDGRQSFSTFAPPSPTLPVIFVFAVGSQHVLILCAANFDWSKEVARDLQGAVETVVYVI